MSFLWKFFGLGFSALLPVVNPLGSALVFLGLVGNAPIDTYRALARRIAINTVIFFAVIELIGSSVLTFFGIRLPAVQLAGGMVLSMIGWSLLNQKDSTPSPEKTEAAVPAITQLEINGLREKSFYPFTFPITAGPGCIVVMLTLTRPRQTIGHRRHRLLLCRLIHCRRRARRQHLSLLRLRP